jgi:excinuclease ABC subunit A
VSKIILKNINHNNFKNTSITLSKNKFIVITGPSGSGKSTLAIDIIYAEGQRKFIESLPSYARQFIPLPEKPDIEKAIGLTPSIVIDQKTTTNSSRSTVGTMSEIYDYARTLFSTFGQQHCIFCRYPIKPMTASQITKELIEKYEKSNISITLPILKDDINKFIFSGYTKYLVNEKITFIRDIPTSNFFKKKDEVEVILYQSLGSHQFDILEQSINKHFEHNSIIKITIDKQDYQYTFKKACVRCKSDKNVYPEISQKLFSFNLPTGACPTCKGIGSLSNYNHVNLDAINMLTQETPSRLCPSCKGKKLNKNALSVLIDDHSIYDFCSFPLDELHLFLEKIQNQCEYQKTILERIIHEINKRTGLLINLGLGYLTLERNSETLSGGELQRIRLAGQLGSGLTGVTYILDEPSIGLHQSDNTKLIHSIKKLRDLGNTIIVIEHDDETILAADEIIDVGPGAGIHGGHIMFHGTPQELLKQNNSETALYLNHTKSLIRSRAIINPTIWFEIIDAQKFNLKNISAKIPLNQGIINVISGISGSGKSTLIFDELLPRLSLYLKKKHSDRDYTKDETLLPYRVINDTGPKESLFNEIIIIDQKPLSGSLRSTIGTYFGFFDEIRTLFASLPESLAAGLDKGAFSFNTSRYRCQNCSGKGILKINMDPLPETEVNCQVCNGKRYTQHILNITYNNKNIFEVLQMNVEQAVIFFKNHSKIRLKLEALVDVGLGYLTLNQSSDTFSGGEAQRAKLASYLFGRTQKNIYILDEPTTGLHFQDIALLLKVFDKLIERKSILIIIEHNIHIIRYADYIIDMGPGGGKHGGMIVASGTSEEIKKEKKSLTGLYL